MSNLSVKQLEALKEKLATINYGSIQLTIHHGQITEIETREKERFKLEKNS